MNFLQEVGALARIIKYSAVLTLDEFTTTSKIVLVPENKKAVSGFWCWTQASSKDEVNPWSFINMIISVLENPPKLGSHNKHHMVLFRSFEFKPFIPA